MIKSFRGNPCFYSFFDRKTDVVNVFLHGWGCDHKSLLFCKDLSKNSALFIDFPPFGSSGKAVENWTIFTYANLVVSVCESLHIKKVNLVGHSFGGRVAIVLSVLCKDEVQKLVLVDSAGVKPKRGFRYYFRIFSYKIRKKLGKNVEKFGSADFLALPPSLRSTFVSVVNTHLDDFLPYIHAKTLVIFGKNDKTTPLYMAKRLKKYIKNSKLIILEDAGHFPFVDCKLKFSEILHDFLENKEKE